MFYLNQQLNKYINIQYEYELKFVIKNQVASCYIVNVRGWIIQRQEKVQYIKEHNINEGVEKLRKRKKNKDNH